MHVVNGVHAGVCLTVQDWQKTDEIGLDDEINYAQNITQADNNMSKGFLKWIPVGLNRVMHSQKESPKLHSF